MPRGWARPPSARWPPTWRGSRRRGSRSCRCGSRRATRPRRRAPSCRKTATSECGQLHLQCGIIRTTFKRMTRILITTLALALVAAVALAGPREKPRVAVVLAGKAAERADLREQVERAGVE